MVLHGSVNLFISSTTSSYEDEMIFLSELESFLKFIYLFLNGAIITPPERKGYCFQSVVCLFVGCLVNSQNISKTTARICTKFGAELGRDPERGSSSSLE